MNKSIVCISSVVQKEPEFRGLRLLAKKVVEENTFLQAIRNPEDVKTQDEFDKCIETAFAILVILGDTNSSAVEHELRLAFRSGAHVIPFLKTGVYDGRVTGSPAAKDLLSSIGWDFDRVKIYFTDPSEFETIVREQICQLVQEHLRPQTRLYENRVDMYCHVEDLLSRSSHEVVIAQQTPTIFLGPRDGDVRDGRFLTAFQKMVLRLAEGRLNRLIYIFDNQAIRAAMTDAKKYPRLRETWTTTTTALQKVDRDRFVLRVVSGGLRPFILADNTFCYKIQIGVLLRYLIMPAGSLPFTDVSQLLGDVERMGVRIELEEIKSMVGEQ